MKVYLSDIPNNEKPNSQKIAIISNEIMKHPVGIDMESLASEVTKEGKTILLAKFRENKRKRSNQYFDSQEIVMLDFDNKDENNHYTINDLKRDEFMQKNASFYYRTFSDEVSDVDKFRVVFQLSYPLFDVSEIDTVYSGLSMMYPQADTSVGQANRLFFGGNKGYEEIDFNNRLDVDSMLKPYSIVPTINDKDVSLATPVYKLLKLKKYDLVKEKLNNKYSKVFKDDYEAFEHFKTINMQELLELPLGKSFLDILHDEESPSASVYFDNRNRIYLYKCFSERYPFLGDIQLLLRRYLDSEKWKTNAILLDITNSSVSNENKIGKTKVNTKQFLENIQSDYKEIYIDKENNRKQELNYDELNCPYFSKYSYNYGLEIMCILELMLNYVEQDKNGELTHLNFFSIVKIRKLISKRLKKDINVTRVRNALNILVITEILTKLSENEIPIDIYKKVIEEQKKDKSKLRTSVVYQVNNLDVEKLKEVESYAEVLVENKVAIKSLSHETVYRLFHEKSNKDFPQSFKPLAEAGKVKMSSKDNNLTKFSESFEKSVVKLVMKSIEEKGFIYEQDIIRVMARNRSMRQDAAKRHYYKLRVEYLSKYNLDRRKLSLKLHKELNIQEGYKAKIIIKLKDD